MKVAGGMTSFTVFQSTEAKNGCDCTNDSSRHMAASHAAAVRVRVP